MIKKNLNGAMRMKQKIIVAVLAVIFALLLIGGLVLSILNSVGDDDGKGGKPQSTTVSGQEDTTPVPSDQPGNTTEHDPTTDPIPSPEGTTPGTTTAPGLTTVPVPTTTPPVTTLPQPTTTPAVTTVPVPTTTPPVTTVPVTTPVVTTPPPTTPEPTDPPHVHSYQTVVTPATMTTGGYTTYTCDCGHSYVGDTVPALTLEQYINAMPLGANPTGIAALDSQVQAILATGDTTYNKLLAVHNYLMGCSQGSAQSSLAQMSAFAGNKVFRYITDLKFSYDAYQVFTNRVGQADQFAAAFTVAARGLGLESYVVSGKLDGASHAWSQVVIDGKMYIFDAFGGRNIFAQLADQAADYSGGVAMVKTGFQSAGKFAITLTVTSDSGTSTRNYTWDVSAAGSGNNDFLQNSDSMKLSGKVDYTITVTAMDGSAVIYDTSGMPQTTSTASGSLMPAAGSYTLMVEEPSSGRSFLITIDN